MNRFDAYFDRLHSDSCKYDLPEGSIALSLADTDFATSKEIQDALASRVGFPLFGYVKEDPGFAKAITSFYSRHYGIRLQNENVLFSTGVIASLTAAIRCFGSKGIGLMTPAYNGFLSTTEHSGYPVIKVPFLQDKDGYHYPFGVLEEVFSRISLFILCNPHNPLGRNHGKEELLALCELAKKHNVVLFSDEIHGPIGKAGSKYLPIFALKEAKEVAIFASSPSKAFNVAGIQTSFCYAENPLYREAMQAMLYADDCGEPSSFAFPVIKAAYEKGDEYVRELNAYLDENRRVVEEFLREVPSFRIDSGPATYLLWIYVGEGKAEEVAELFSSVHVYVSSGTMYEDDSHIRMNIALPKARLLEALNRIKPLIGK